MDWLPPIDSRPILFVGSGFSNRVGMPNWKGLLRQIAAEQSASNKQEVELLLDQGQEYSAADRLELSLGRDQFDALLRSKLLAEEARVKSDRADRLFDYGLGLKNLNPSGIITTNWDGLLEAATGMDTVMWPGERASLVSHLQFGSPLVLHLHGCIHDPRTPPQRLTKSHTDEEEVAQNLSLEDLVSLLCTRFHIVLAYGVRARLPDDGDKDPHIREFLEAIDLAGTTGVGSPLTIIRTSWDDPAAALTPSLQRAVIWDIGETKFEKVLRALYDDMVGRGLPFAGLDHLPKAEEVFGQLRAMSNTFRASAGAREAIRQKSNRKAYARAIVNACFSLLTDRDAWTSEPEVVQKAANIIYRFAVDDLWWREERVVKRLGELTKEALGSMTPETAKIVDPLAFMIDAVGGDPNIYREFQLTRLNPSHMTDAFYRYATEYYLTEQRALQSYEEHVRSRRGEGPRHAHDLWRILTLLGMSTLPARQTLTLAQVALNILPSLSGLRMPLEIRHAELVATTAARSASKELNSPSVLRRDRP